MDLQELITRGRFIFDGASQRLKVFELVNGRKNARAIARATRRHVNNVHRDLKVLSDAGLIQPRAGGDGDARKEDGMPLYEKVPLARTVSLTYFTGGPKTSLAAGGQSRERKPASRMHASPKALEVPSEVEILDICKKGEDQLFEFKSQGTEARKIAREVAALLNTRRGGCVFYGVDDDGTIHGTDVRRHVLDQPLQNALRNTVQPAPPAIRIHSVNVLGTEILVIAVPPWNRRDVYHYEDRVLIRKGTNVFAAKPEENRKLHRGEFVV